MKKSFLFLLISLFVLSNIYSQRTISWKAIKNITVVDDKLVKNDNVKQWWNAGAGSVEMLPSKTDGWVQSTINKPKGARILGLSNQNTDPNWNTIQYGFYLMQNGVIQILENGKVIFTSKIKVNKGDIVKVERKGTTIYYKKNDEIVYTSKRPTGDVLYVDVGMYTPKIELSQIKVSNTFVVQNESVSKAPLNFEIIHTSVIVEHVTEADIIALNQMDEKEKKTIKLNVDITQEDFDRICTQLQWIRNLDFSNGTQGVTNFEALKNLKQLESIRFSNLKSTVNNPIDCSLFSGATNLKEIEALWTRFKNGQALNTLTRLEKVVFLYEDIDDLEFLKNNPNIKKLEIIGSDEALSNYDLIGSLSKLEILNLQNNDYATEENLEVLKNLSFLKSIYIPIDKVTSLDFLSTLTNLERIIVGGNNDFDSPNIDVSGLKNLTNLKEVHLSQIKIIDLSPLQACTKLEFIDVYESTPQDQIDQLKAKLPSVEINVSEY